MTLLPNNATRYERALEEACGWFKDLTVDIGNFYRILPEEEEVEMEVAASGSEIVVAQSEPMPDYTPEQGKHTAWQGKPTAEQNKKRLSVCPKEILPHLAYAFSVDEWDEKWLNSFAGQPSGVTEGWSELTQRRVVDASLKVHRKKGTRRAIEEALSVFGALKVKPVEWWELDGVDGESEPIPYDQAGARGTFDLDIELADAGETITKETYDKIHRILDATKNCRSHLLNMNVTVPGLKQKPIVSSVAYCGETVTVFESNRISEDYI